MKPDSCLPEKFPVISDEFAYVDRVLELYLSLPETPARSSQIDIRLAHDLYRRQVPLEIVEAALLFASVRRVFRDPSLPPLAPIRSLHYFLPVIEEVSVNQLSGDYLSYLRYKLDSHTAKNSGSK
jgi:hypothetical protein